MNDARRILGVWVNINAKLDCPVQKSAAGKIKAIVDTTTNNKLVKSPKIIVFWAVFSP